jgi:hypothetical protein
MPKLKVEKTLVEAGKGRPSDKPPSGKWYWRASAHEDGASASIEGHAEFKHQAQAAMGKAAEAIEEMFAKIGVYTLGGRTG